MNGLNTDEITDTQGSGRMRGQGSLSCPPSLQRLLTYLANLHLRRYSQHTWLIANLVTNASDTGLSVR